MVTCIVVISVDADAGAVGSHRGKNPTFVRNGVSLRRSQSMESSKLLFKAVNVESFNIITELSCEYTPRVCATFGSVGDLT